TQREWIVASPFTKLTWGLILLSLDLLTVILYFTSHKSGLLHFCSIHRNLFGILVNQSIRESKDDSRPSSRMVLAAWILTALVLSNAYSSSFYSILILNEYGRPLDSIEDLLQVAARDSKAIVMNGRSIYWYD